MIKLNLLTNLAWRQLRPRLRLLLAAAALLLLLGVVTLGALTGARSPAQQPAGQPVQQQTSSTTPSSSAPAVNRLRSSPAAAPTRGKSVARPGPVPAVTSAVATPPPAPGRARLASTRPGLASSSPRPHVVVTPSPSTRPRSTAAPRTPAPAPTAHLVGTGGLVGSVNSFRAANGASSLDYSSGLTSDAESCALQMSRDSQVAHCGGNQVVAGAWSTGGCMDRFESDPDHRAVLLSAAFTVAGSGVAQDAAGAYYCVVNFG